MKVIGNLCEMRENNPVCFDETMVGAAGDIVSLGSIINNRSI